VLWEAFNGYILASLRALADEGVDLLVFRRAGLELSPFDTDLVTSGLQTHAWEGAPDLQALDQALEEFDPDAMLVISWHIGAYRKVSRRWRGRTLRILAMSNPWEARPKQMAGVAIAPFAIRPAYDAALHCDERSGTFAIKLGFPVERLIWGMNTCDHERFAAVADRRGDALPPKTFLFVGRLVSDKAIDALASGYASYRRSTEQPWPLVVAGRGPHDHLLRGCDGVEMLDFVQPNDLPALFERAGCLVLPSRYEPWGVVIHEATAAGLPVVCSRACGASTRLVLDGYNGVVISPGDPAAFSSGLRRIHEATDEERLAMGTASRSLAQQYTPARWARNLLRRIPQLREEIGLPGDGWETASARADASVGSASGGQ
jgi:glycosyltransferase involved in cell wall biosynthesis